MPSRKLLIYISLLFIILMVIGVILGAFLRLINEIKFSLAYFLPYWLVNPIFFIGSILLVFVVIQTLIPWLKRNKLTKKNNINSNKSLPKNKVEAAHRTIESIDSLLNKIQNEVSKMALKKERDRVQSELSRGDLVVVFFGTGSSGKTSLIRALLNEIVGEVGAAMGSTKSSKEYRLRLKGLERGLKLIDTPGIFEAGRYGRTREENAKSIAIRADLIVFVIDSDLKGSELEMIKRAKKLGKSILLVLNKCDLRGENEEQKLIYLLRGNTKSLIPPENIVATSASPQSVPRLGEKPYQPNPEIESLLLRLASILHSDGEELIADNILFQCNNLSDSGRDILNTQRRNGARRIIDRYSWISSGVVAANPLPGIDLLGTAAVNVQLVIEIAKVYGVSFTRSRAKELSLTIARTLVGLGLIKGSINIISTALHLSLPTIIIGKVIQSVAAAWLTRISGASLITYFEQNQDWGDGGVQEVVRKHYDLNRRSSALNKFIELAFKNVIKPLDKDQRQLPPRQRPLEEEELIPRHEDQEW